MNKKYSEYLKSKEWKNKGEIILERDNHICALCGVSLGKKNGNVHHITYKNIYKENNEDLISLCRNCHKEFHEQKLPFNKYLKIKQEEIKENEKKERYILMETGKLITTNKAVIDRMDNSNNNFIDVGESLINKNFITCIYDIYEQPEEELLFPEISDSFFTCA